MRKRGKMGNPEHVEIVKKGEDAIEKWRKENLDTPLDLSGADLRGEDLSGANLRGADLREADLSGADLSVADLSEGDLSGAYLSEANLSGANLSGANLSGADLFSARLETTDFGDTNFEDARFCYTVVADCDLSKAVGLEKIRHYGPSSIGLDTILRSKGQIPEVFLRGAGVPDDVIKFIPSFVARPFEFYSCFISYSSKDKEFCDRLYADLQAKNIRCWYFPEDAEWGKTVWGEIDRGIRFYDKLVVICSEHSLQSGPVLREIERGLQREDREHKEVLFPIAIDSFIFEKWEHSRQADVLAKVVGDFTNWKDHDHYKKNFDKLLKSLNKPS